MYNECMIKAILKTTLLTSTLILNNVQANISSEGYKEAVYSANNILTGLYGHTSIMNYCSGSLDKDKAAVFKSIYEKWEDRNKSIISKSVELVSLNNYFLLGNKKEKETRSLLISNAMDNDFIKKMNFSCLLWVQEVVTRSKELSSGVLKKDYDRVNSIGY